MQLESRNRALDPSSSDGSSAPPLDAATVPGVCPHCTLPLPRPGRKPRPMTAQGSGVRGLRKQRTGQDGKSSKEGFPTPDKHMARLRGKNNATGCGASQPERWRNTWQSSRISLSSVSHPQRGVEALVWIQRPRAKPRHHVSRLKAQSTAFSTRYCRVMHGRLGGYRPSFASPPSKLSHGLACLAWSGPRNSSSSSPELVSL